ncbi:cytochrome c oxidase subunit 2A [Evansella sp. LMS18]|uniref:cytochrome c oxidase subunit 2A n=1 Tax=Evansella sp. LMS18 TaxID=2924033 RepID=UPI0020D05AD2|nr:cytochrome c oxidase subunit 2A [Evansella sp. LMS18]UTR08712.1 cytochrome c oxidase subunit 2A [Evansella sp. LMS18]
MSEMNKQQSKSNTSGEDHTSLKTTLIFTMTLGVLILLSWFAVFFLFLERS